MATSRDIQEVIAKLSSDRAKPREEGIKLLNTWLEGERSIGFCRLLAKNTARIKPDEIPHAETWPFLITLLMKCVELEISGSKKRPPKLLIAKTLRTAIQCAEDPKFGGKLLLLSVVKQLFNHIWDVIKDVPNFHSEYSSVLRLLLAVKEYRYQMRKRVYCCLVVLYMKKVVMSISIKTNTQFSSKEELFRHILTFHVLLENPPGDFPSNIMDDIVGGFIEIFSNIRDEGKISRKLMDCINTYLIKDGPNLGCQAFEIHSSIQEFMMRCWLTTHDRGLKNSFIIYARIQLKLNRSLPEGSLLIEQFLDVVAKELDQGSVAGTCTLWNDTSRDEKVGSFGSTQKGLMELAAAVFYQACTNGSKKLLNEKRLKMEDATVRLKDALMKGSWLWNGAFSFLIRNYGNCMNKSLLIDWFEVACQSLQRILNNSVTSNSYEALLWLLRALQELSPILVLPNLKESSKDQLLTSDEAVQIRNNWNVVSTSLMHSLPTFSNATPVVDAALVLLGNMIVREQAGAAAAPQDMWDLMIFKQKPSRSALYFISCYFSRKSVQGDLRDALHIRRSLLRVTMELVNFEEPICLSEDDVTLIPAAVFSLCAGSVANLPNSGGMTYLSEENKEKFLAEGDDQKFLAEVIECSVEALSAMENGSIEVKLEQHHGIRLPQQVKQPLIHEMEDYIATLVASEECVKKLMLADLVNFCSLLCNWIYISIFVRLNEMKPACMTKMHDFVSKLLDLIACKVEEKCNEIKDCAFVGLSSVFDASGASVSAFQCLLSCPLFSLPKESTSNYELLEVVIRSTENILAALTKLYAVVSSYASASNSEIRAHGISPSSFTYLPGFSPMDESGAQIVDMDLDIDDGSKNAESFGAGGSNKVVSFSPSQWKLKLVSIISAFFSLSPPLTWQTLFDMIEKENDDKVSENILYNLCKYFHGSAGSFSSLVSLVINIMGTNVGVKLYSVNILSAIHALLATLLSISSRSKLVDDVQYSRITVPEENLSSLAGLVNEVAETGLPDWFARITLIDCICNFVLLEPHVAQVMIGRLLALLQDTDYRVRLFLAKKVGILFQTWDGHDELFHDICSNFGFYMVRTSKEKLIKAKDVLTCGPPSMLVMETALITLAHLALYSEEIENEAVFMICVVAAIDPSQRKLTYALLDNLSQQLKYPSRTKVSIISFLLSLTSSCADPEMPSFTKDTVVLSVQTIVDGFFEMDESPKTVGVVDKINIFRPDRVFKFLVEIHYQITIAIHPRHKCHRLSAIEALIQIIGHRATVSSTSNYIFNILGQLIDKQSLQDQCCRILSTLLEVFKVDCKKDVICVLGEQLQFLVSKLVACCIPSVNKGGRGEGPSSRVITLLHQLTVDADISLSDYIRELEPFPEIDCLERMRKYHEELCKTYTSRDRFLMFVRRSLYLPKGLLPWSLRALHRNLREIVFQETSVTNKYGDGHCWSCDPEVVTAVWNLVHLCNSSEADDMSGLLADFISRVGIGDPYRVVFHLPGDSTAKHLLHPSSDGTSKEAGFCCDTSVSEEVVVTLLKLLKKFLSDDSAKTVDLTSRTLKGILSTDRGQGALLHLTSFERSVIAVHSKGANLQVVEKLLLDSPNSGNDISLDDSSLWCTSSKTYDTWICLLVHSLIGFCNDIILRLCQDIVLLKSEVAELLFANVLVDLAGKKFDFCKPISTKVEENIFSKSNNLIKSVQLLLSAMNSLRSFYATEKARSTPTTARNGKPSSSTKSRGTSEKLKERSVNSSPLSSLWEKVYWLSIDYLVVAEAAIRCGSYFTAIMYVEHWCEEQFNGLTLGCPDFSHKEQLPQHIELLVGAVTQINEPDSVYGIIQSHKLKSQLVTCEHEGNWSKALEYYDLLVRFPAVQQPGSLASKTLSTYLHFPHGEEDKMSNWKCYKGLMRSLQKTGCTHVLDTYGHGLTSQIGYLQNDSEFTELQYEAAWRAGNWDFSLFTSGIDSQHSRQYMTRFNESLHSCLRALQEGDAGEFCTNLTDSKKELVLSISNTSRESTEHIYSTIVRLQMLDHLGMAWDLHWKPVLQTEERSDLQPQKKFLDPIIPTKVQMESLDAVWSCILRQAQLHMNLLEPFIAFRRVMLQILGCKESMAEHLLQSASTLRKGSRFSLATAALHELKQLLCQPELQTSHVYFLGRLEEAKVLRAQGQHEMAISLARYILSNYQMRELASSVYRLVGKWLAETCSSNSRTILEQYLKHSVELIESNKSRDRTCMSRQCQTYFQLAHYTDGLFKSYEERLASNEWQAAMRLRKHKTKELDALIRRLKGSTKGDKTDYSIKIQELQKQLTMDREEAEKLEDDRDSFLSLALEGYEHCLVIGGKYDLRVVFRLVSLWFSLYTRQSVVKAMHSTVKEVQSYKFIPLVYQIASRLGSSKDGQGSNSFQLALVSLLKKMAIDHPYHTLFQLLALANGDRIKDKQRSRNSFIVDMDKKLAAENLLNELSAHHGAILRQMKQMVEIYIKLAELETKKEETNKRIPLPRDVRSLRQLELVPVVTANIPVDHSCQYKEGSFPHFSGLADSVMVMNGINAPKVIECFGSDGRKYRQLAKSGNDDLRQDAVMEQFFGLVNTFLQNHRDTWRRKLGIRTYKVVPFTPSAGVLEWVDRTIPLGEYLLGSSRNGGAHARYGIGDWSFLQCREHMANEKDKRKAFLRVCDNFRPVMHHFFLERFLQPADWFERRLSYTRSVAASSMVGYIVGLGDRHSMNILIDQATAEVVHIDLGVAFEQGLMLKTPERVPFRLTRDVIDGMGITGVEGVFRRCCEETLSVMRTNKEALLTIIEVFIHDPLYKWALSPLKALQRQKETDYDTGSSMEGSQDAYEGNKDAARATLRVKQKLDGYEDGEMRSVQGQVQQLIQDAIDTDRLCQMFPGWGAWL
ncbi:uncharacterized protein A4U43_C06F6270 [Asparagus officinalis]|uniref:Serine/threonine-protein kinase ATM n=1 Tax=Asparagus officinalis TaxID=4686 RepID=A0A5P1EQJ4_ASPOF|nr:uncharacterized protein A4U43_C06F6270 [Asparagus officinalis]